jgi:hypothetical protein
MLCRILALALALAFACPPLRATSVTPPSFSALTARAETIVRAAVLSTHSELVERAGSRAIFTYVTFRVDEVLKGSLPPASASTAAGTLTLEFLGGTVGELSMDVVGIPTFTPGQSDILFIEKNGAQICPLVAMMFGRYHVQRDAATGTDYVTRDNGTPLTSLDQIGLPFASSAVEARLAALRGAPLTASAFAALIREETVRVQTP